MRRLILFYESSEGGAGILRQLVEDPGALARVAREALLICHFDPDTGEDKRRAPGTREDCGAACYDCMMSYSNQREHELLDRQLIRDLLRQLAAASIEPAPADVPRAEHLAQLKRLTGSNLENRWLDWLEAHDLRLPSRAQTLVEQCRTRPDFMYDEQQTAVYIDGPPHEFPERKQRDQQQTEDMEDYGYTVVRFSHDDDWLSIVERYPHVFGTPMVASPLETPTATTGGFEADLFPAAWQSLLSELAKLPDVRVEPGADVTVGGRVAGSYIAEITRNAMTLFVVDAASDAAESVADALRKSGKTTITVNPTASDAAVQLQTALGGP
jgi:very-short-patch-repair endonuclease